MPPFPPFEVIVLVDRPAVAAAPPRRPLASFIGAGTGSFKTVAEVDAYIRELRDEWDR